MYRIDWEVVGVLEINLYSSYWALAGQQDLKPQSPEDITIEDKWEPLVGNNSGDYTGNSWKVILRVQCFTWTSFTCSKVYSPCIHLLPWSPCLVHWGFPRDEPCFLYRRNTSTWGPYMWYQKDTQRIALLEPLPLTLGLMMRAVSLGFLGNEVSMYMYQPWPVQMTICIRNTSI